VQHRIKILSVGILRACFFWNFSSCCHILVELNLMRLLVNMIEDPNAPDRLHIEVSQTITNITPSRVLLCQKTNPSTILILILNRYNHR
jgi:hypothetical protein